jgi:ribosomal protein L37AE/L43A
MGPYYVRISDEDYFRFSSLLKNIESFVEKHDMVSYIEFDYYVVHDMTLFSVDPDFDFEKLKNAIGLIRKTMPAVKRIFGKPIVVLKDSDDVLPVENARIINQSTFLHLANHTHNVSNLTKQGVKPRKLLTRIYEDDYGIYENVVFCNFIDEVLSLIKKNERTLNSLLYASNVMKFNLLEKVNHVDYFLALGKLHTGYIRDFNRYFILSKELLGELSAVKNVIHPRLCKPVYKKNATRNPRLALRKTNIFLMQKDYRQVYRTYKFLQSHHDLQPENKGKIDYEQLNQNFLTYVRILTLFAIGHFNFEIDPKAKMNLRFLNSVFFFKGWKLIVSNTIKNEIILQFSKDHAYRIMIAGSLTDPDEIQRRKEDYEVDEVIIANPFDEDYVERDDVYISMEDVDSFRRIQQILLKGMVYSDRSRDVCPFCGGKLHKDPYRDVYQCNDCMTQIKGTVCPNTCKPFFYTDNAHLKKYAINITDYKQDEYWFYKKKVESSMFFRNITKIDHTGAMICPFCKKTHSDLS